MLEIKRVSVVDAGAFGVMMLDGIPFAVTLERTYDNNAVKLRCGVYYCYKTAYYRGGYPTYEISVPGHDRILFHKANVETELDGCIAIGEQFGILNGKPAILQSGVGFNEFMRKMENKESFDVLITE